MVCSRWVLLREARLLGLRAVRALGALGLALAIGTGSVRLCGGFGLRSKRRTLSSQHTHTHTHRLPPFNRHESSLRQFVLGFHLPPPTTPQGHSPKLLLQRRTLGGQGLRPNKAKALERPGNMNI